MKTNRNATRKYIVSRCGKLKLSFQPKYKMWLLSGGGYGTHSLFEPNVYNGRVAAHWTGYIINNGLNPCDMTFNEYTG